MFKRFLVYFDKYRKDLIGGMICVIFEGVFEMVIPFLMAQIIDVGVMNRNKAFILDRSLAMVACALAALLLGSLYARFAARAGQGFGAALREAEYKKMQSYSFSNMDHFSTPSLITRLTSDVTILQNAICNGIRPMVRGPFMLVIALTLSIFMSRELAVVFFVALPVLGVGLYLILRQVRPMYAKMQEAMDKVNSIVQENLIAIRTVKSFVRGDSEARKFSEVNTDYVDASRNAYRFAALNMPYLQLIMYATIICLLWFGGNFIHTGSIQVGQLTGFLSYVMQVLNALMMISSVFLMLSRSTASAARIDEVLEEEPAIVDGAGGSKVEHGEIEFDHVFFKYKNEAKEYVLSDISFHVKAGQTVGIIGGTGSAKSSLVQLIPRLYDVTSGSIRIDGRDVREYELEGLRDAVGMVLQNNTLFSGSIRENLQWGNEDATDEEIGRACRIACVDEFLVRLPGGLEMDLGQGGVNVSGGQKQRLCIARALLKRPRILIFDDSTSAVDTATEASIRKGLTEELRDTTKIIITQRIGSVEAADMIIVLENGRINEIGSHAELLDHNMIYQDIYMQQTKGATA